MARGWIAGLLTGVVVTGLGLGVVSLVMGPVGPAPEREMAPQADAAQVPAPETAQPEAETAETAVPELVPEAETAGVAPEDAAQAVRPEPEATPQAEADVAVAEPVVAPAVDATPEPEAAPQLAQDDRPVEDGASEADAGGEETATDARQDTDLATEPEAVVATPVIADEVTEPEAAVETPVIADAPVAPEAVDETPVIADEVAEPEAEGDTAEIVAQEGLSPETETPPESIPEIIVEAAPEPAQPEPGIGNVIVSPEADLPPEIEADPAEMVVTDRLPRIGEAPAQAPVAAREPALSRNALAFAPVGDQPRLAFLLIDTGPEDRAGLGDLGKLPFPVSVAIDASATDAQAAMDFYRGQGAEVVLTVPLPEAATATDVDVTIEAYRPLLADAIGVLAEEGLGFQTLGEGAVQLATNLAETGHGLVSYPAGLNTGHKAALKEGVQAGLVFRDLDGAGQGSSVIRRFLDNAAFKARNEDGVIVVARTRPETLQALLEWSLGTRAQTVALAPVSAILAGESSE